MLVEFFESLQSNDSMRNLDLSWNQLGINSNSVAILVESLSRNTGLVHIDISHNNIDGVDSYQF